MSEPTGPSASRSILEIVGLSKSFGSVHAADNIGLDVRAGEALGIVGPNGAGKSTLLRALVGERAPDAGELKVGNSIQVAYYDQQLGQVPLDKPLYDVIAELRPQEDVESLRRVVSELPAGYHRSGRWRHRRKDGAAAGPAR